MISVGLIHEATSYYREEGFAFLPVPFVVSEEASAITAPKRVTETYHAPGKVYSGSAEQGVIQRILDNTMPVGRWQALTPCMRDEPVLDDQHLKVFLKLELVAVGESSYEDIIQTAQRFWSTLGVSLTRVPTECGEDLYSPCGVELGSYGVRTVEGVTFAFGTGITEPRSSMVLAQQR